MGPGEIIGAERKCVTPFYLVYSPILSFSSVWDYVPGKFECAGDVAPCGASDAIAWNWSPLEHLLDKCINRDLSDIRRSTFNRAILRSWSDKWTLLDPTMELDDLDWRDLEIMVHDCCAILAHDHRVIVAINQPSLDETAQSYHAESPYKMMFFPL